MIFHIQINIVLDLHDGIQKDHIEMYDKHIIDQVCYCKDNKDKLVELPITLSTNGLFSNKQLLDKYHKDIPKTCNELINTSKEILEKERALNNTELVGYNGLMN
eukprot:jgi/Orpsp1_1/1192858/evm.model.d7180000096367.1